MTEAQDSGVRLYNLSAYEHLRPKSVLYKPELSKQELLEALHDVLPRIDVVVIRRVEDLMTAPQKQLIDLICEVLKVPPPKGYPNIPKRVASDFISEHLSALREAEKAQGVRQWNGSSSSSPASSPQQ